MGDNMTTDTATIRVSYWAKANRYAAACCYCGGEVAARAGYTWKDRDAGKYLTACHDCARANNRHIPYISRNYAGGEIRSATGVSLTRLDTREAADAHICCDCGQVVGLVKSTRGRWYICAARSGGNSISGERTRCAPWVPHTCPDRD